MAVIIADTAHVDPRAELDDEVEIGPFCVVGPGARLGRGTRLLSHVCLMGRVTLGKANVLSPFVVIGGDPQDRAHKGGEGRVEIGDENILREGVTINRGSEKESGLTRIGSRCLFMAGSHVAHDCVVGDGATLSNDALLGGHVHVEPYANLSAGVAAHHYVTVGRQSFVGAHSRLFHDVPPYMLVDGQPARVRCINIVGLKRQGLASASIDALHEAHRLLYRANMAPAQAIEVLAAHDHVVPEVQKLLSFLEAQQAGRHGRARERLRDPAASLTLDDE